MRWAGHEWIGVGIVLGAHGIRGYVRIRSFTVQPADVAVYGPVWDKNGARCFSMRVLGRLSRNVVLAALSGIASRSEAEGLRGLNLFVPRSALPEQEEETFYWADLIGLAVLFTDSASQYAGRVQAVHDFGAGAMLEIDISDNCTMTVPFTRAAVPAVNVDKGWVMIVRDWASAARP